VKLVLMNQYDDEHPAALIDAVGTRQQQVRRLPLYEIDRYEATPLTTLYVGPMSPVTSFEGFQQTVARLRAPEGCPWDREQTHQSLRTHLLEESYEVLEAIDGEDLDALQEELGDLLLQIVLHAQIAVEEGEFRMSDVIAQIDAKLKRRHPHVWGGIDVTGVGDVVTNWEAIKRQEREDKGDAKRSLLDSIPSALPALAQASAYTDRAGRIGFDSMEPDGVWVDLPGYLADAQRGLLCALSGATEVSSAEDAGQVLGDVLLVIADWARRHGVNAESMLREANRRFAHRFRIVEEAARASDKTLTDQRVQSLWIETGFER